MSKPPEYLKPVSIQAEKDAPPSPAETDVFDQTPATEAPEPFSIDFDLMRSQGFFAPSDKAERLALQMRAVKRRLLRRLKFQKISSKRHAAVGDDSGRPKNIVLTTSTRPAEGKTFTSINLATSLAVEDNIGTVLIDADALRPKVLKHFGLPRSTGFTDLIEGGDTNVRRHMLRESTYPLSILSEGMFDGRTADLYAREETGNLLQEISQRYPDRIIIVDAPPVLAAPDAVILARYVDEVLFVVEANQTPEPAVATALDELLDVNERVSLVLNRVVVAEDTIHYGSYKEYYQDDRR